MGSPVRLLGAHLPGRRDRRETLPGECGSCKTRFEIDARLPLPATCPDCGGELTRDEHIPPPRRIIQPTRRNRP